MTKVAFGTINDLIDKMPAYIPAEERLKIKQAYEFADTAHSGHKRQSGEYYIQHDLAVAQTVSDISIDTLSTTAALLHDSLMEHTKIKPFVLANRFGERVADIVNGLEKLDPYLKSNNSQRDVEVIRRAVISITEGNPQIVLIRMADCLQDLHRAHQLPLETQHQIAQEARNIYAPIANRLGIWKLKWQLEDLSFRYLNPQQYKEIAQHLKETRASRLQNIEQAIKELGIELEKVGLKAYVVGRPKHIYSIHRKMERKKVSFHEIYDAQAIRVVLETEEIARCYQVLGIVHNLWMPIPQEFDDYIARPKPNGYQSLHTAVIDSQGETLEVQIRTHTMHEKAERGVAAHWAYKEGGTNNELNKLVQHWQQDLWELVHEAEGQSKDQTAISLQGVSEHIYVFSPRGDVFDLPAGATSIDFAYQVHTEIGNRCRGAKVNGLMVSLDHKLKNGDRVEIIAASRGGPSRDWLNESLGFTASARTRSKIRQWFRNQEREQNILQGREVVERELKRLGLTTTYTIEDIAHALKYEDVEQFLMKVGFGDIQSTQISGAISLLQQKLKPDDELLPLLAPQPKQKGLTVLGLSGLHTRMAQCCHPIPPEKIVGYITRGRGVTVHRQDCSQVTNINEKERLIEVEWGVEEESYPIPIVVKGYSRPGLMTDITNLLKGRGLGLNRIKSATANSVTTIYLVAQISNLTDLDWLLRKLESLNNVIEVRRQRWTGG